MRRIGANLLVGLFVVIVLAVADGGVVEFQKQAGEYSLTVFSAPVPLRVGVADLSVMVQRADNRTHVLDCDVTLHLSKPGADDIHLAATRAQATNKLLYSAHPLLQEAGRWNLTVEIAAGGDRVHVNGTIAVLPDLPAPVAYWPYFSIVPVAVALFALNQWLKAARKVRNP